VKLPASELVLGLTATVKEFAADDIDSQLCVLSSENVAGPQAVVAENV